jgi:DNA-directed RNA polymerase alpha subunit
MINWDKLSLDIVTDGTITPEEAFNQSAKILIEQFESLIKHEPSSAEATEGKKENENKEEVKEKKSKKK